MAAAPASAPGSGPAPGPATSARPDADAEALMLELSHDLMSPYCPGRTIATCPSPQARKLEAQILDQARSGQSREDIEQTLVARFPDIRGYIGRPELVWGTAVGALVALTLLFFAARRWVRGTQRTAAAAASPDAAAVAVPGAARRASGAAGSPGNPSQREIDALDDALDRVDEF
ncbi:cytochrome c-type biogenesis protein [Nannocystis punicea]|uniref:Cytochrome c-type biogenesis protein n=1 Tax=Nannocystis punicea TaxID=2995304 RepID=A0ABY7HI31_9BACT|nr:cytochrome c-type biogenesis protein CcmH [Nannocystis poenicansa]WAS98976.1 cytochrome c-type biogenesis protein CcmH [Nannocystis poenicansa]